LITELFQGLAEIETRYSKLFLFDHCSNDSAEKELSIGTALWTALPMLHSGYPTDKQTKQAKSNPKVCIFKPCS
jgi:hypothetical protein